MRGEGRDSGRGREMLNGVRQGRIPRTVRNICIRRTRGKQRRRARYRLFPGAPVSDLAGDVNVGIQEESRQTTTTTRGSVSNLRRIYPRKAPRRLLPAPSTCGKGSHILRPATIRFARQPLGNRWNSRHLLPALAALCTRTFYCERLGGN